MSEGTIIVLAGNFYEFLKFYKKNKGKATYKYGGRASDIRGVEAIGVEVVGTFRDRKDADELETLAQEQLGFAGVTEDEE